MKLIIFITVLFSLNISIAKHYIAGVQRVTFRLGPSVEHRIISMVENDTPFTVLEQGTEWSKVRDGAGREGYVMNRFLTKSTPATIQYERLNERYKQLQEQLLVYKKKEQELNQNLTQTKRALASTKENLDTTNSSYEELKTGSEKYLELKSEYSKTKELFEAQSLKVDQLNEKLSLYYLTWFLAGAGILFLGWVIGFLSRKRKHSGYGSKIQL